MAFHVRNIATAKAKTAFSRGAAIVTNNKENRVTLYTMKYNAADYNSAKVMSYPANIKFGEFKRRCSEKMSCTITRIFTISGGEIEMASEVQDDDRLVCSTGQRYVSVEQQNMQRNLGQTSHFDAARPLSLTTDIGSPLSHAARSKRVLKRFKNAVRNVRRMSNTVKNIKDKNKQVPESNITSEGHSGTGNQNTVNDDDESIIGSLQDQDVVSMRTRRRSHASSLKDQERSKFKRSTIANIVIGVCKQEKPIIISPESNFRLAWDAFVGILVVYYTIIVPVRVAFDSAEPTPEETVLDMFFNAIFIIDIVLNFRTAVKLEGVLIEDPVKIRNAYLKSWFLIDFLSTVPVDLIFVVGNNDEVGREAAQINKMLRLLRIFKLLRMMKLTRILARIERYAKIDPSLIRLSKLVGILVSTWHMIACCYWFVAMLDFSSHSESQWIPPTDVVISSPFSNQYAHAFFWAVVVTSGIGWDIYPETPAQVYFTTVAIVTGLLMYAVIIGSASTLLSNLDIVQSERKRKLDEIRAYLRHRKVGKKLREEIFEFYEYLFSCNVNSLKESDVLSELPQSLQLKLNLEVNRQVVNSVPLFHNCSEEVLASVIEQLYQIVMLPGEYACEQGDIGEEMYFIVRGRIQIIYECQRGTRTELAIRKDGEFFGETALINNQPRSASAKALSYCDMLVLARSGFAVIKHRHAGVFDRVELASTRRSINVDKIRGVVAPYDSERKNDANKMQQTRRRDSLVSTVLKLNQIERNSMELKKNNLVEQQKRKGLTKINPEPIVTKQ